MKLGWLIASLLVGCAPSYAYHFDVSEATPVGAAPGAASPVSAHAQVGSDDTIRLALSNLTDDVVQVEWTKIAVDRGDHTTTRLHPATDLGWIAPGQTVTAVLVPFALPRKGHAAAAYEGRTFELTIPLIVHREPAPVHIHLVAHVQKI